jgi:hypothetical protein
MEDSTGIVDMFSQATKYVYMEWLYLPLIYLWLNPWLFQNEVQEYAIYNLNSILIYGCSAPSVRMSVGPKSMTQVNGRAGGGLS